MSMSDVYILSQDLQLIGVVDAYKSLIWANRYRELGDFELYIKATTEALDLIKIGRYAVREDDDMICRINKIELTTSGEEGNYLAITGTDAKSYLDQRIIWGTRTVDGNVETFIRSLVTETLISPTNDARRLTNSGGSTILGLGAAAGLTETATEQMSYKNIGEKVREFCQRFGWGYKVTWTTGALSFSLYKGTDRTDFVIFSDEFENLSSTRYTEDHTNLGNVALVAGVGEGEERSRATVGFNKGTERFEFFVDADSISDEISFEDLKSIYPLTTAGGTGSVVASGSSYFYQLSTLDIRIIDQNQRAWLLSEYTTGSIVTVSGVEYFRITNINVAELPSDSPGDDDTVQLLPIIYATYLTAAGKEALSEYGAVTSFEGSVIPNITFTYKEDYFLGDLVTVRNEYGITKEARIVEVIEVNDDAGYSVEPIFEYIENEEEPTATSGQTIDFVDGSPSVNDQRISALEGDSVIVTQNASTGELTIEEVTA